MDNVRSNNNWTYPFVAAGILGADYSRVKAAHDIYRVYVNDDFVGEKESYAQGDGDWHAVDNYLKENNFNDYQLSNIGERVDINVKDPKEAKDTFVNLFTASLKTI